MPTKRKQQPERALHTLIARWLDHALPKEAFWFPIPSASLRNIAQAANMKRAGELKVGLPDLCVVFKGRLICMELKAGRNRPTPQQLKTHAALTLAGAIVTTIRTIDAAYDFLSQIIPLRAKP